MGNSSALTTTAEAGMVNHTSSLVDCYSEPNSSKNEVATRTPACDAAGAP
jgi:hypothetical protein